MIVRTSLLFSSLLHANSGVFLFFPRESRSHCIDIETAYVQGCEMLDQAVLVRESCLFIYIFMTLKAKKKHYE